jgi:hypothetical protein
VATYRIVPSIDSWGERRFVLQQLRKHWFLWTRWSWVMSSKDKEELEKIVEHLRAPDQYV